jgi:2-C-methyl-D-erythritol 2,4-cyclodiphosphate synthase
MLQEKMYVINNIDATIIAQKPKLLPHIDQMIENIAQDLHLEADQVNVKATTEEGLGFTGRMEGIAAQAICSLSPALDFTADDRMGGCGGCPGCRQ